jgi:hypothetical protein
MARTAGAPISEQNYSVRYRAVLDSAATWVHRGGSGVVGSAKPEPRRGLILGALACLSLIPFASVTRCCLARRASFSPCRRRAPVPPRWSFSMARRARLRARALAPQRAPRAVSTLMPPGRMPRRSARTPSRRRRTPPRSATGRPRPSCGRPQSARARSPTSMSMPPPSVRARWRPISARRRSDRVPRRRQTPPQLLVFRLYPMRVTLQRSVFRRRRQTSVRPPSARVPSPRRSTPSRWVMPPPPARRTARRSVLGLRSAAVRPRRPSVARRPSPLATTARWQRLAPARSASVAPPSGPRPSTARPTAAYRSALQA